MRSYVVYICSSGCGYSELSRSWDSAPIGNLPNGELGYRCPECGAQVWDHRDLTKAEALSLQERGFSVAW